MKLCSVSVAFRFLLYFVNVGNCVALVRLFVRLQGVTDWERREGRDGPDRTDLVGFLVRGNALVGLPTRALDDNGDDLGHKLVALLRGLRALVALLRVLVLVLAGDLVLRRADLRNERERGRVMRRRAPAKPPHPNPKRPLPEKKRAYARACVRYARACVTRVRSCVTVPRRSCPWGTSRRRR